MTEIALSEAFGDALLNERRVSWALLSDSGYQFCFVVCGIVQRRRRFSFFYFKTDEKVENFKVLSDQAKSTL